MRESRRTLLTALCAGLLTAGLAMDLMIGNGPAFGAPPPGKGGGGGGGVTGPAYAMILLGTLGGDWATTTGMNNHGDVVGLSENEFGTAEPYLDTAAGGMVPLNDLVDPASGWIVWQVYDINDSGVIVGYGYFDSDGDGLPNVPAMAIRFLPDDDGDGFGAVEPLSEPGGPERATAINADGDIAGPGYLWRPESGILDLGTFNETSPQPADISDRDDQGDVQLVGRAGNRAFRFTTGLGFEDLGTLKTDNSGDADATTINSHGDVAGWADANPKKGNENSFAFLFVDGIGMSSLGTLSTGRTWNDSAASSLNDKLEVVGMSMTTFPDLRAFYYHSSTGMVSLEDLIDSIPASLQGTIAPARINNNGQICGPHVDNFTNVSGPAYIISPKP